LKGLRNQIVHHGIQIDEKRTYFIGAIDYLEQLCDAEKINNKNFLMR